jgi:acyl-CoA thioester hydrolase
MNTFASRIEVRWSDLDPNFHVRHSAYYDYGASSRVEFLHRHGITAKFMQGHFFGPMLFREECVFRKEIRFSDIVTVDLKLRKARKDYSRWTILHHISINDNILAAVVTVDGAWIDLNKRKLTVPPAEVGAAFEVMPKDEHFDWAVQT